MNLNMQLAIVLAGLLIPLVLLVAGVVLLQRSTVLGWIVIVSAAGVQMVANRFLTGRYF